MASRNHTRFATSASRSTLWLITADQSAGVRFVGSYAADATSRRRDVVGRLVEQQGVGAAQAGLEAAMRTARSRPAASSSPADRVRSARRGACSGRSRFGEMQSASLSAAYPPTEANCSSSDRSGQGTVAGERHRSPRPSGLAAFPDRQAAGPCRAPTAPGCGPACSGRPLWDLVASEQISPFWVTVPA